MSISRRTATKGLLASAVGLVASPAIVRAAEPLVIAYIPANAAHWICDVLIDKPFLKDLGFDPAPGTMQSSTQAIQQIITGSIQMGSTQPEPLVAAVQRGGTDVAAISAPMNRPDWILNVQPGIKTAQDLKGKLIGVSALKNSEVWLTQRYLEQQGLSPKDYDFIVVGPSPAKFSALTKGSIAGAVLFQPLAEVAVGQGFPAFAKLGVVQEYAPTVYAVSRKWAATNDAGKRLGKGIQQAHQWMWDPRNKDECIAILAKYSQKDKALLATVYKQFFVTEKIYSRRGEISVPGFEAVISGMIQDGETFLDPRPDVKKFLLPEDLGGIPA